MLLVDAYARQRCNAVLSACSVVCVWYAGMSRLCDHELARGRKTDKHLRVSIRRPHADKPGNRLIHSRRKNKFDRLPRVLQCSDRAQTLTNVSGRASGVDVPSVLPRVLVQRDIMFEKNEIFT